MPDDAIIVLNVSEIAAALDASERQIMAACQRAVKRWLLARIPSLARYPPPPASSTYRRTGTLGRTWASSRPTWAASPSGFDARLGNATPYAPFVQDEDRQAWMHAGAWYTVQDAELESPALETGIETEIAAIKAQLNRVTS